MRKIALAIVIGVALLLPQTDSVFAEQSFDTDHFTIVYHLSGPNKLEPTGSDAPGFAMPDGTVCNDWPSRPDFINKLACWLE